MNLFEQACKGWPRMDNRVDRLPIRPHNVRMLDSRVMSVAIASLWVACGSPDPKDDVAAQVGPVRITMAQVDDRVRQDEPRIWQNLYDARKRALEHLVDENLLRAEVRRLGVERDSLIRREVTDLIPVVSDSAVADFYDRNEGQMAGQPLAAMADRIREHLATENHHNLWSDYLGRLRERAEIEIQLLPPRALIQVNDSEPSKGPVDAPITLVEYSDFECTYCGRAQPTLTQVLGEYGDRVRLVYRDFPLSIHANAHLAAQAGACAHDQGRFWDYHDTVFANIRHLRPDDLRRYAVEMGLDSTAFDACLSSERHAGSVDADLSSGQAHGVTGTPAFFINGRLLSGARPFSAFQELIDDELDRLGQL